MSEVKVEQVDREAAAYYVSANFGARYHQSVIDGAAWTELSECFARHRIEATRALSAEVEALRRRISQIEIALMQGDDAEAMALTDLTDYSAMIAAAREE